MIETYGREFENDDYNTISALLEKSVRAVTIGNTKTACNRIFQAIQKFEESDNVFINGDTNENRLVTNQVEDETRTIRSGIWKVYLLILGSIIENIRDTDDLEFVFTENSQKSIGKAGQRLGSFSRLNEFPRSVSALQMQIEIAYGSFGSIEIDVFEAMISLLLSKKLHTKARLLVEEYLASMPQEYYDSMNSSSGSQGNAVYLCYTNLIRTYVLDILCVIELFDFAQDFIKYNDYLEASFVQNLSDEVLSRKNKQEQLTNFQALKTAERAARKKQLEQEKAKQDEDRKKRAASMVSTPTTTKGYTSKHADSPVAAKKINEIVRENITGESSSRPAQTQVEAQDSSKNSSVSSGHKLAASYLVKLVKNNMGTINIVILIVLVINYIRKKYPMGRLLPLFVEKLKIATTMATKITYM